MLSPMQIGQTKLPGERVIVPSRVPEGGREDCAGEMAAGSVADHGTELFVLVVYMPVGYTPGPRGGGRSSRRPFP